MRQIVLDTETTGLSWEKGNRVVEIGCVELLNHCPSGRTFHVYINPERSMPIEAFNVHGLSEEFLSDKPVFATIAQEFAEFIAGAKLVIHNAAFDVGFINMEFKRLGLPPIEQGFVVDTLSMARRKHPGASNSLDALCSRYGIDNSRRTKHGALLDAELLAEVYIDLIGARQSSLILSETRISFSAGQADAPRRQRETPLAPRLSEAEIAAHAAFVATLGGTPIWNEFSPKDS